MADERKPGELRVGDNVNTPDGPGKITALTDLDVSVDLDNDQKGLFKRRYVSLA